MSESIFGDMDTEEIKEISDNPWGVDDGWYHVFIEKAWKSSKEEKNHANFTFKIDEPENGFHGMPVRTRFQVFPGIKSFNELDADEQRELKKLKKFLTRGCDLSKEEAAVVRYEELISTELFVKVRNTKSKDETREFTNVVDAVSMRLAEEMDLTGNRSNLSDL